MSAPVITAVLMPALGRPGQPLRGAEALSSALPRLYYPGATHEDASERASRRVKVTGTHPELLPGLTVSTGSGAQGPSQVPTPQGA